MTALYLGILLFGVPHFFAILWPQQRDGWRQRLGEGLWKGLFSLVSLAGLALMGVGYWQSRAGPLAADLLYLPPDWARHLTMLLVLLAFILIAAAHGRGHLKTWLRQPFSLGFALWAAGHLIANGKRSDVYLFGTFLAVALADIAFSMVRGKGPAHVPQWSSDLRAVAIGVALYFAFLYGFHPFVLNVPVVP